MNKEMDLNKNYFELLTDITKENTKKIDNLLQEVFSLTEQVKTLKTRWDWIFKLIIGCIVSVCGIIITIILKKEGG